MIAYDAPAYVQTLPVAPRNNIESDRYYWIRTTQSGDHWFLARRVRGRWQRFISDEPLTEFVLEVGPKMFAPIFTRP